MKEASYSRDALKTLKRMPKPTAQRIRTKLRQYAADPAALANNVTELKGSDTIRLRIGDWRVIMREREVITVIKIGPRGAVYAP